MDDNTNTPKLIESLYEAALKGDVVLLEELLNRDPLLLYRPLWSSNTSPLHVACKRGHKDFVLKLLHQNRSLEEELDPNDKSSILHQAARNGHLELVTSLASGYPSMCFARDMLGRNPVHVAAIKGQLHVLEELLNLAPAAARERVGPLDSGDGDTILHLCVKCDKLDALTLVVKMVGDAELLNATNVDGNTILHVAVANKRTQIVKYLLLEDRKLEKNTQNSNGLTAMDVFEGIATDVNKKDPLRLTLRQAKVLPSKEMKKERNKHEHLKWLEKKRNTLMIVASLIATMAFQAGINPPGGVWQDTKSHSDLSPYPAPTDTDQTVPHDAGTSVLNETQPGTYTSILVCNMVGFVLSMSCILMLISGLPCRRFFIGVIMVAMWVAIICMVLAFIPLTYILIPDHIWSTDIDKNIPLKGMTAWICLMALFMLGHVMNGTCWFIKLLWRGCLNLYNTVELKYFVFKGNTVS